MTSGSALMSALDSSSTMSRPIIKWLQSLRNSSNLAVLFEIICSCCHFNLSASCTSVFLASTRAEIQFETLGEVIYFSESRILKEFHNSAAVCFSNTIQRVQFNESDYFNFPSLLLLKAEFLLEILKNTVAVCFSNKIQKFLSKK